VKSCRWVPSFRRTSYTSSHSGRPYSCHSYTVHQTNTLVIQLQPMQFAAAILQCAKL